MASENCSVVTEFILLRLTDGTELKMVLFALFLVFYASILVGNLGMIILTQITPPHTYVLFPQLSFICRYLLFFSHCTKMLISFLVVRETVLFSDCIVQHLCFGVLVTTEGFLLSVMAFDHYVAIANPLLYAMSMSKRKCTLRVIGSVIGGTTNSLTHTISLGRLSFCGPNVVGHFFCSIPSLLILSCSDTSMNEFLLLISGVIVIGIPLIVAISYFFIAVAILRIHSAIERKKAFSTCASHLTAVTIFYGTLSFNYIQSGSQYSVEQEKVVSVFYTLVIPMLNPMIYSLRNKEVKEAAKRAMEMKFSSC